MRQFFSTDGGEKDEAAGNPQIRTEGERRAGVGVLWLSPISNHEKDRLTHFGLIKAINHIIN